VEVITQNGLPVACDQYKVHLQSGGGQRSSRIEVMGDQTRAVQLRQTNMMTRPDDDKAGH
jgi:hypothetical protein